MAAPPASPLFRLYPWDLSEREWAILVPLLPPPKAGGRPRTVTLRVIVHGSFHVRRSGCPWRLLPREYGPWSRVSGSFRTWRRDGTGERGPATLRERVRRQVGRQPTPSAAMLHSQSVKTTQRGGPHGDAGAKQLSGRQRHRLVDTRGLVLRVVVHPADLPDRAGAPPLLLPLASALPRLERLWADSASLGPRQIWVWETFGWRREIVAHPGGRGQWRRDGQELPVRLPGFQPLPHRWMVARPCAWIGRTRRLSKDDECLPVTSAVWVYLSRVRVLLKRVAHEEVQPAFHYRRVA